MPSCIGPMLDERPADLPPAFAAHSHCLADPEARALTLRTLDWATQNGVLSASRHRAPEVLVLVASVYAHLCAPKRLVPGSLDIAARFTLLFFYIDDAPTEGLAAFVSDAADWSIGPLTSAMKAWQADLRARGTPPRSLDAAFTKSFHDYIRARRIEPEASRKDMSIEDHWAIRRRTIFMDPYLDQWLISSNIDTESFATSSFDEARRLGTDIVLLSNDLGSVERDVAEGVAPDDLNLVDTYARARSASRRETVEHLVPFHNEMVSAYKASLARALEREPAPAARDYADLLTGVVDGNLASLWTLDFRYRGVDDILTRLDWIEGRAIARLVRHES